MSNDNVTPLTLLSLKPCTCMRHATSYGDGDSELQRSPSSRVTPPTAAIEFAVDAAQR